MSLWSYEQLLLKLLFCDILRMICHIDFKCGRINFQKPWISRNLDMNESEIIEFSVQMWADVTCIIMKPFSYAKFIVKAIYLELSDKIPRTCVLGRLFLFFLTEVYWKSNKIFCLLWIRNSSEQEQYIYIVYDKSIAGYIAGSLSWAANFANPTANEVTRAK